MNGEKNRKENRRGNRGRKESKVSKRDCRLREIKELIMIGSMVPYISVLFLNFV